MPFELKILMYSVLWGIVQILLAASSSTMQRGIKWNMSSRDQQTPPLTGVAGRLSRASENFKETFPLFMASVLLVQILTKNSAMTALGAQLYLLGRVLYVPIYAFGVPVVRSLVWTMSMVGIVMVLVGVLF